MAQVPGAYRSLESLLPEGAELWSQVVESAGAPAGLERRAVLTNVPPDGAKTPVVLFFHGAQARTANPFLGAQMRDALDGVSALVVHALTAEHADVQETLESEEERQRVLSSPGVEIVAVNGVTPAVDEDSGDVATKDPAR